MNSTDCSTVESEVAAIAGPPLAMSWRARLRTRAERGATAVEYALMVGLIAVGIITAVASLRDKTSKTFNTVNSAMGDSSSASAAATTNLTGWTFFANHLSSGAVPTGRPMKYVNAAGADEITSPFMSWGGSIPCYAPTFTSGSITPGGKCYYQP